MESKKIYKATVRLYKSDEVKNVIDWSTVKSGKRDSIHQQLETITSLDSDTNDDGTFEIYVTPGTYDILLDREGYLDHIFISRTINTGDVLDIGEKELYAGDVMSPQRGRYMRLAEIAKSNAEEYLSIKVGRTAREISALEELARMLGLKKPPLYIESYDISNLGSSDMVAGMIVFENGRPCKKMYKKFSIKENVIQNDLACMQEVMRRRFKHYLDPEETDEGFKRLPDLILLDGGKNQLAAVNEVLWELDITVPVFGMVKDNNHRTRAITSDGGEIGISETKSAFLLVTRIQDEVHRFAITYQRNKHRKSTFELGITNVKGIGEKKAMKLLTHFKTVENLKKATVEEIAQAGGISQSVANDVYEFVQNSL